MALPNGVYRVGGSGGRKKPAADLYQANQDRSFHVITRPDPLEQVLTYSQVIEISPCCIVSRPTASVSGNANCFYWNEIDPQFRDVPQTYSIQVTIPTPKQGRWRVTLSNYLVAMPPPLLQIQSTFVFPRLAYPGEFVLSFPSSAPPLTRYITSRPVTAFNTHAWVGLQTLTNNPYVTPAADTKRVAIGQTTAQPPIDVAARDTTTNPNNTGKDPFERGFPASSPSQVGWHFPFNDMNCQEGLRRSLTVTADTTAGRNFGQYTLTKTASSIGDYAPRNAVTTNTLTADAGTDHGIPLTIEITRSVYYITIPIDYVDTSIAATTSSRTAKVYLNWELLPLSRTVGT